MYTTTVPHSSCKITRVIKDPVAAVCRAGWHLACWGQGMSAVAMWQGPELLGED